MLIAVPALVCGGRQLACSRGTQLLRTNRILRVVAMLQCRYVCIIERQPEKHEHASLKPANTGPPLYVVWHPNGGSGDCHSL